MATPGFSHSLRPVSAILLDLCRLTSDEPVGKQLSKCINTYSHYTKPKMKETQLVGNDKD